MKKTGKKGKLLLTTEKVRDLSKDHLDNVAGGTSLVYNNPLPVQQTPLVNYSIGGGSIGASRVGSVSAQSTSGYSG